MHVIIGMEDVINDAMLVRLRPSKAPTCKHELCRLMYRKIVSFQDVSEAKHTVETGQGVRIIADKEFTQRCKSLGLDAWQAPQFKQQDTLITKKPFYVAKRLPLSDSE